MWYCKDTAREDFIRIIYFSLVFLHNCFFAGTLPSSWSSMTSLIELDLDANQLSGTINMRHTKNQMFGVRPRDIDTYIFLHTSRIIISLQVRFHLLGPV